MTPQKSPTVRPQQPIFVSIVESSLGLLLVASSVDGICAVFLGDDANELTRDLQKRFPHGHLMRGHKAFLEAVAQVLALVEEPRMDFRLAIDLRGTPFQLKVWQALLKIPLGTTTSYGQIAQSIGSPTSARAVAAACAANPVAVVVPCHRVLGAGGQISGYRWGVERKRWLLKNEVGGR